MTDYFQALLIATTFRKSNSRKLVPIKSDDAECKILKPLKKLLHWFTFQAIFLLVIIENIGERLEEYTRIVFRRVELLTAAVCTFAFCLGLPHITQVHTVKFPRQQMPNFYGFATKTAESPNFLPKIHKAAFFFCNRSCDKNKIRLSAPFWNLSKWSVFTHLWVVCTLQGGSYLTELVDMYLYQLLCLLIVLCAIPLALAYGMKNTQSPKARCVVQINQNGPIMLVTSQSTVSAKHCSKRTSLCGQANETRREAHTCFFFLFLASTFDLILTWRFFFLAAKIEPLHIPVERLCMSGWFVVGSLAASVSTKTHGSVS